MAVQHLPRNLARSRSGQNSLKRRRCKFLNFIKLYELLRNIVFALNILRYKLSAVINGFTKFFYRNFRVWPGFGFHDLQNVLHAFHSVREIKQPPVACCTNTFNGKTQRYVMYTFLQTCFFSATDRIFFNGRKKLSHFGQNVRKYRLINTVTASINTTVRHVTEIFQWPKCLSKKMTEMPQRKKSSFRLIALHE